jgi:hypothetical protein
MSPGFLFLVLLLFVELIIDKFLTRLCSTNFSLSLPDVKLKLVGHLVQLETSMQIELLARHLTTAELEAGLDHIRESPKDFGVLRLIVRRPSVGAREVLAEARLDLTEGLVGDNWKLRPSSRTPDGSAHPDMQLNIINARVAALVAQDNDRWQLAGDQLYLDLDLSANNLPAGTQLAIGTALIEVTPQPHTGCKKFVSRFGVDAMKFVNSAVGKELNLRGINAKVIRPGVIRLGDTARKRTYEG